MRCRSGLHSASTPLPAATTSSPAVKAPSACILSSAPKRSTALPMPSEARGSRKFPVWISRSVTPYSVWERMLV